MEKIPANFRDIPAHFKLMRGMHSPFGSVLYAFNRLRAKCTPAVSVNSLGKGTPHVSLSFLAHPSKDKSDGFILTARTEKEMEVWVSDGGFATEDTLTPLLSLREQLLKAGDLEKEISNPRFKLNVTYLVSHFHIDHINEGIYHILPSPFICVKRVYFPHISVYAQDREHEIDRNGDIGLRSRFMLSQKAYQPLAEMVDMPFGACRTVSFGEGKITLMMPDIDWGQPACRQRMNALYGNITPEQQAHAAPVQVVNSNCLIARIEYANRSMLLTGDAMKKTFESDDEPFDLLVAQYGDALRSDIVKYPHHGQARNPAWKTVRDKLLIPSPDAMVVLTGHEAYRHAGPYLTENNIPWVDLREGTQTFTITKDGKIRRTHCPIQIT